MGLISLEIVKKLIEMCGKDWIACTDFYAGTSTGAIIALTLAKEPRDKEKLDEIELLSKWYEEAGPDIFKKSRADKLLNWFRLFYAPYSSNKLKQTLEHVLPPELKLGDIEKKVLVPAFDIGSQHGARVRWHPKIFHNFTGGDLDAKVLDTVLASTAAPTFFPSYNGYIDGGVFANNPSMCAFTQLLKKGNRDVSLWLKDVRMISIGSGDKPMRIKQKKVKWGLGKWGGKLVDIMFDGTEEIADYQCAALLGEKSYRRIQLDIPYAFEMDDAGSRQIEEMKKIVRESDLSSHAEWIQKYWL